MAIEERYIGLEKPKPIYCPRCVSPLIPGEGLRRYETLDEHVFNPNGRVSAKEYWICSNEKCLTRKIDCFWDYYGSSYGGHYGSRGFVQDDLFILNCRSAINSEQRNFDISYRHKDIPILNLIWFRVLLEKYCVPDELGINILKHKYKWKTLYRSRGGWCYYTPGIKMFFFCIRQFNYAKDRFLEDHHATWTIHKMYQELEVPSWDKRWWKLLSAWILNKLYLGLKEKLACVEKM